MGGPGAAAPWFLWDDAVYFQRGTLVNVNGTEDPAHPITNLAAYEPSLFFQAGEQTMAYHFDLGAGPEETDAVVVVGLQPTVVGCSVTQDPPATPVALLGGNDLIVAGASGKLLRYWRDTAPGTTQVWRIDNDAGVGNVVEAGRYMVGKGFDPTGDLVDFSWSWVDDPSPTVTPGGVEWTARVVGRRVLTYVYQYLSYEDAQEWMRLYRKIGTWGPLAVISPDRPEETVHGKMRRQPVTGQAGIYWRTTLQVSETAAG